MHKKRILTTSIISWSELSGGDTFSNLLEGYGADNVASIYIRGDEPTSTSCNNYFRINEASVLKSIFKRKIKTGTTVERAEASVAQRDETERRRYGFFNRHRLFIFLLLRELGWKFGRWNSKELNEFIDNFKPDVLLFAADPYIYINRINLYIAKKTKAKVVSIIWDDNFTYKSCTNLSDRIFRFFVKRQTKKIVEMSSKVITIAPKTKREVDAAFGVDSIIITKSVLNPSKPAEEEIKLPLNFLYAGNLYIGRDKSLALLSKGLEIVNKEKHCFNFNIYVNNMPSEKVIKQIENEHTKIWGHISKSELEKKLSDSDILVFAESLEKRYAYAARLSFSTKIVDYLASGKAIFAIGKADTASMEYFKDNDAAFCVSSYEEILEILGKIAKEPEIIKEYAINAYTLGKEKHSREETALKLQTIIDEL